MRRCATPRDLETTPAGAISLSTLEIWGRSDENQAPSAESPVIGAHQRLVQIDKATGSPTATCRPGRTSTTAARAARRTSRSCGAPPRPAGSSRPRPASAACDSSAPLAAAVPARSKPARTSSPPLTRDPKTSPLCSPRSDGTHGLLMGPCQISAVGDLMAWRTAAISASRPGLSTPRSPAICRSRHRQSRRRRALV